MTPDTPANTENLNVQKDTRSDKPKRLPLMERLRRESGKARRMRKARLRAKHNRADPFPKYKYVTFKNNTRKLSEDASEEDKEANAEVSFEKALVLTKGYPNLPTQRGIQVGMARGHGKQIVGTKGRIRTRTRLKANQKNKPGIRHV